MLLIPFFLSQFFLAKLINKFRWKAMLITDSRVRTMNEILNSIKLIKMYAWEDSFEKKIAGTVWTALVFLVLKEQGQHIQ